MTDSIVDFAKNIFADWVFIYRFGKYIGMRRHNQGIRDFCLPVRYQSCNDIVFF
ncbi:hypothetical protein D088_180004 [Salmonella enterica subsp. houtenae serovar 16:z4,z32:-- str. RKS3027]|nr:hypothetical protein D088_180004 [Salmonella enterica subsp. houtenae serovar 16:z4,z32:-- str. RKS3027]